MPYEEVVDRPDSRSDVKDNFKKTTNTKQITITIS